MSEHNSTNNNLNPGRTRLETAKALQQRLRLLHRQAALENVLLLALQKQRRVGGRTSTRDLSKSKGGGGRLTRVRRGGSEQHAK